MSDTDALTGKIKNLLQWADFVAKNGERYWRTKNHQSLERDLRDAADTIERLQEEIAQRDDTEQSMAREFVDDGETIERLMRERDAKSELLLHARKIADDNHHLRTLVRELADRSCEYPACCKAGQSQHDCLPCRARAALEGEG